MSYILPIPEPPPPTPPLFWPGANGQAGGQGRSEQITSRREGYEGMRIRRPKGPWIWTAIMAALGCLFIWAVANVLRESGAAAPHSTTLREVEDSGRGGR